MGQIGLFGVELPPVAPMLMQLLRAVGYTASAAITGLIDNGMGALAKAAGGGGLERAPLIGVVNIARAIRRLREAESWCVRLDADAKLPLARALPRVFPVALILGPEGSGLRRLPHEACEALARIPIDGASGSHNLSADVAIALYELARGE